MGDAEVSNNKVFFIESLMQRYQDLIDRFSWSQDVLPPEPPQPSYDTDKTYMVFTVRDNQTINLSSHMNGITNVNWGDGTIDTNTSHTYTTAGDYDVIIKHSEDILFSWRYCYFLKEIKSIGKLNKTDFSECFLGCSSITSISSGAFDNCVNVTNFFKCFDACTSITSIPQGLFDNNVNVTDFSGCFYYCNALTSIPTGLFDKNVNATNFFKCFGECILLTSIPVGLFDKNVNVTNFSYCFSGCTVLNQPYNCTSPELPKLWERDGTNGAVTVTDYTDFATSAHTTFRATVPSAWGGTMM